jgi:hypothetical protein
MLQMDGQLPIDLKPGSIHRIPARSWHRVIMGESASGLTVLVEKLKKGDKVKVDGKKATVKVPDGRGDLIGVDFDDPDDMEMVPSKDVKKLKEDKIGFGSYDTWSDPSVAFKDSDLNVTDKAQKFAMLMDKVAEELGLPEPVITSGLRPPDRQVKAMLNLWKNHGSQYVIDLYAQKCKSCSDAAGQVAEELVALWDENKIPLLGGVPKSVFKQSMEIVAGSPISEHQNGNALDYGIKTNPGDNIKRMVDHIGGKGLATYELIDETQGQAPHWHVSVYSITPSGIKYLETPNMSEAKKKKMPGEPEYYVGDKSKKTKSNKQMAQEINKCAKEPRPKSCYDEWSADKTYKKKKNESADLVDDVLDEALDDMLDDILTEKISEKTRKTLKKKAEKANMPLGALTGVYRKGLAAWLSGHRQGVSQHAWAMGRTNSFIRGGKARKVDKSEWKKVQKHRK